MNKRQKALYETLTINKLLQAKNLRIKEDELMSTIAPIELEANLNQKEVVYIRYSFEELLIFVQSELTHIIHIEEGEYLEHIQMKKDLQNFEPNNPFEKFLKGGRTNE